MKYSSYYQQTPIMRRILEYMGDAVYVKGSDLDPGAGKKFRRYDDILHAMGGGSDVFRSNLDFTSLVLVLDLEYANKSHPGEIFHNSLETFNKLEPVRDSIKNVFRDSRTNYIEVMTGQGYNYALHVDRESPTYKSLLKLGRKTRVLPWTAAKKLVEKQERYSNAPLLKDHIASTTFGRLNDYIFDTIRDQSEILMRTSDVFDNDEIAIFDTTQHGYLLNRRAFRIAFSLHQKTRIYDKYNYQGPPIVTIPVSGLPLEDRIRIRQDERDNYKKAVGLARESKMEIPQSDLTGLITDYLMSETFERHKKHSIGLGVQEIDSKEKEEVFKKVNYELPEFKPEDIFWDIPDVANWDLIKSKNLDREFWNIVGNPNDKLLIPGALRYVIRELKSNDVDVKEIVTVISQKYKENHNWSDDLWKNDPNLRAEYWVRTLDTQL